MEAEAFKLNPQIILVPAMLISATDVFMKVLVAISSVQWHSSVTAYLLLSNVTPVFFCHSLLTLE